jgi:hypothetical protein
MENSSTTLIPQRSRNAVALDRDTLFRMTKSYAREANFCLCGDHSVGFAQSVETILGRSTSRWEDCYAKSGGIGVAVNLLLRSKHRICATPTDGPPKSRIRARELGRSSRESPRFATLNLTLVSISDRSTALRTRQGSAGRWWPDVESEKKFEVEPLYKSGSVAELVQPTAQFNALSDTVPGLNLLDCTPAKPHGKSCVGGLRGKNKPDPYRNKSASPCRPSSNASVHLLRGPSPDAFMGSHCTVQNLENCVA